MVFRLTCFIRSHLAHNWYWQRGSGVNDTAKPDGTSFSATHCIVLTWQTSAERCLRRDGVNPLWNFSKNEQHGFEARLPLAVVYCFSRRCVLVLHCNLVVSTMTPSCILNQKLQWIYQNSTDKRNPRTKIINKIYSRLLKGNKKMWERSSPAQVQISIISKPSVTNLPNHPSAKVRHIPLSKNEVVVPLWKSLQELASKNSTIVPILLLRCVLPVFVRGVYLATVTPQKDAYIWCPVFPTGEIKLFFLLVTMLSIEVCSQVLKRCKELTKVRKDRGCSLP